MNKVIEFLLASSFFATFAFGLLGPIYAVFVEGIGGDLLTAGIAYGLYTIVCGVMVILMSVWENRADHKETIIILARILMICGFAGYLFVSDPISLFVVEIILGVSLALVLPAFDTVYSRNIDRRQTTIEWGAWEGTYNISLGISSILGAAVAQAYGFRLLFFIMFLFSILALAASIYAVKSESQRPKNKMHRK